MKIEIFAYADQTDFSNHRNGWVVYSIWNLK